MKNTRSLASALLVLTPIVVLTVPGCSGGSTYNPFPTATPTGSSVPTATPTGTVIATPTATSGPSQASNLTLGNGQRAILTTRTTGTNISGTLQILAATATTGAKTRAIPFTFAVGTYTITGTVTPPRGYSIQGNFGTFGAFQMTGQLPTATQPGSYTLTVNGQTETGVIPIPGQPFPTATPTPTSPGGVYNLTGNLTFSNVSSGSDVLSTPITSFNDLSSGGTLTNTSISGTTNQSVALSGNSTSNGNTRSFSAGFISWVGTNFKPFTAGQVVTGATMQLGQTVVQGTSVKIGAWRNTTSTVTVKAIGTNSITFDLDAHFEPTAILGGNGSFDLKGTLTATGLTVKNQ